jgi:hypothetical protein
MLFKNLLVAASSVMYASTYVFADEGFEGEDSLYGDEDMGGDMEGYGEGKLYALDAFSWTAPSNILYTFLPLSPSLSA